MSDEVIIALLALSVPLASLVGAVVGAKIRARTEKRNAAIAAQAQVEVAELSASGQLIESLQQELERYRLRTDKRLDELEVLVRGYRAFISVQRDHMSEHQIPLPPWPDGLPR